MPFRTHSRVLLSKLQLEELVEVLVDCEETLDPGETLSSSSDLIGVKVRRSEESMTRRLTLFRCGNSCRG